MYFIESNQQIASNNKVNCKWRKRNFFFYKIYLRFYFKLTFLKVFSLNTLNIKHIHTLNLEMIPPRTHIYSDGEFSRIN